MAGHELHAFSAGGWLSRHLARRELDQLKALARAIADNGGASLVAVVGSVSRERRAPTSDVDVIVIAENPAVPQGLHLDALSVAFRFLDDFQDRLSEGESFAFCALRDARPAYDTGLLNDLRTFASSNGLSASAEDALRFAQERLGAPAGSDVRGCARAVANVVLLSRGILPFSGPELEDQLRTIDQSELAELVRQSRQPELCEPQAIVARLREIVDSYANEPHAGSST